MKMLRLAEHVLRVVCSVALCQYTSLGQDVGIPATCIRSLVILLLLIVDDVCNFQWYCLFMYLRVLPFIFLFCMVHVFWRV